MPVDENEKTRAELIALIEGLFTDPAPHSITPAQFQDLFTKIVTSMFMKLDEFTYPATVETLEISSQSSGLTIDGTKVVGGQQPSIPAVSESELSLAETAASVNAIIVTMKSHGLIATPV